MEFINLENFRNSEVYTGVSVCLCPFVSAKCISSIKLFLQPDKPELIGDEQ